MFSVADLPLLRHEQSHHEHASLACPRTNYRILVINKLLLRLGRLARGAPLLLGHLRGAPPHVLALLPCGLVRLALPPHGVASERLPRALLLLQRELPGALRRGPTPRPSRPAPCPPGRVGPVPRGSSASTPWLASTTLMSVIGRYRELVLILIEGTPVPARCSRACIVV